MTKYNTLPVSRRFVLQLPFLVAAGSALAACNNFELPTQQEQIALANSSTIKIINTNGFFLHANLVLINQAEYGLLTVRHVLENTVTSKTQARIAIPGTPLPNFAVDQSRFYSVGIGYDRPTYYPFTTQENALIAYNVWLGNLTPIHFAKEEPTPNQPLAVHNFTTNSWDIYTATQEPTAVEPDNFFGITQQTGTICEGSSGQACFGIQDISESGIVTVSPIMYGMVSHGENGDELNQSVGLNQCFNTVSVRKVFNINQ